MFEELVQRIEAGGVSGRAVEMPDGRLDMRGDFAGGGNQLQQTPARHVLLALALLDPFTGAFGGGRKVLQGRQNAQELP